MNKAAADHTRTVGRVSRIVNDASVVLSKVTVYMTDFNLNIRVVQLIFGKSARHTKVNGFLHFAFYAQVAWPVTFYWFETDARIRIVQASTKTKVDAGSQSIQRLERRSKDQSCVNFADIVVRIFTLLIAKSSHDADNISTAL